MRGREASMQPESHIEPAYQRDAPFVKGAEGAIGGEERGGADTNFLTKWP